MTDKEDFIEKMKQKTKQFAVDIIRLCKSLKSNKKLISLYENE